MSGKFALDDYITVAERVTAFYAKFPDGSLQSEIVELNDHLVVMRAYAYRAADDIRPGIGYSSLGIPGATPYTRGSEVENCESSAWGRAIAALGFEVKRGIASAEEVRNKTAPEAKPDISETRPGPAEELMGRVKRRGIIKKGDAAGYKLDARQGPDGHVIGFRLEIGDDKAVPQCLIDGPLGEALWLATAMKPASLVGKIATVAGILYYIRGDKSSWYRLHVDRIETDDWILPADTEPALPAPGDDVPLVGEAESEPLGLVG